MSTRHRLHKLLRNTDIRGRLWLAGQNQGGADHSQHWNLSTGFVELDEALGGGWPLGALTELLVDAHGVGELQLLLPALQRLASEESRITMTTDRNRRSPSNVRQWVMLIAPPYIPYAPAFMRYGLDLAKVLVVRCRRQAEVLWSAEQALQSGSCAAILAWSDATDERALRRLQLAAEATRRSTDSCWLVLFRGLRCRQQRSPAALRMSLRPTTSAALNLNIFKNRGGRPRRIVVDIAAGLARSGAE